MHILRSLVTDRTITQRTSNRWTQLSPTVANACGSLILHAFFILDLDYIDHVL